MHMKYWNVNRIINFYSENVFYVKKLFKGNFDFHNFKINRKRKRRDFQKSDLEEEKKKTSDSAINSLLFKGLLLSGNQRCVYNSNNCKKEKKVGFVVVSKLSSSYVRKSLLFCFATATQTLHHNFHFTNFPLRRI